MAPIPVKTSIASPISPSRPQTPASPVVRRALRWLFAGLLAVACIAGSLALLFKDEPEPDISDLVIPPRHIPAGDNAYTALVAVANRLESTLAADPKLRQWIEHAGAPDAPPAPDNVDHLHAALLALRPQLAAALALPQNAAPRLHDYSDLLPELMPLRNLARALALDARASTATSDLASTSGDLSSGLRSAQVVETSQGPLITYFTGSVMRRQTLAACRAAATTDAVGPSTLAAWQQTLRELRPTALPLADAFRVEIAALHNSGELFRGNPDWMDESPSPSSHAFPPLRSALLRLGYDHNQTVRLAAQDCRHMISLLDGRPAASQVPAAIRPPEYWFWKVPNLHNFFGRNTFTPAFAETLLTPLHTNQANHAATEVWLALLRYQHDHAELPATLAELVPDYLDAVPTDPFGSGPLRYDPALHAVWSVGQSGRYRPAAKPPGETQVERGEIDFRLPEPNPATPPAESAKSP